MNDFYKKTREAIFLNQISFLEPLPRVQKLTREEVVLEILYQSQQESIKNNQLGSKPDLYSIASIDMSDKCFAAINFDLLSEMRNVNARKSNFSLLDQDKYPGTKNLSARFGHSTIIDSNFSQANFSNCQMAVIFFENSNFSKARFQNGLINSGRASKSNFQGAGFNNMQMINFSFQESNLTNTDFSQTILCGHDINFINHQMKPVFSKDCLLKNIKFVSANLELVLFEENQLVNTSFKQALIKNSAFKNSFFQDVSFKEGSFFSVEIEFSDQRHIVDFSYLDAQETTWRGPVQGNFFNAHFFNSDFREADLSKAVLRGTVFDNCQFGDKSVLDLDGAEFIECSF
jgi:uncharacterized protein YjbI with pentapeptide repeats